MSQPVDYKDFKALSQSHIKLLEFNPRIFYDKVQRWLEGEIPLRDESTSEAMRLGSLVDCMCLTPELLWEQYITFSGEIPKPQGIKFCEELLKLENQETDKFECAYFNAGIKNPLYHTFMKGWDSMKPYYDFLKNSRGKIVIDSEMMNKANNAVNALRTNEFIRPILWPDKKEKRTQVFLKGYIDNVLFKGLVDLILIDHEQKIVEIYDLKTTSETNFSKSFYLYRYDIQQNVYEILLKEYVDVEFPGYSIQPMRFITVNTKYFYSELWYDNDRVYNKPRMTTLIKGEEFIGLKDLIENYKWHYTNNRWDFNPSVYAHNGLKFIN